MTTVVYNAKIMAVPCPVAITQANETALEPKGDEVIAISRMRDPDSRAADFVITMLMPDGAQASARLNYAALNCFANLIAAEVEAENAGRGTINVVAGGGVS
jgi:hypothetical protein